MLRVDYDYFGTIDRQTDRQLPFLYPLITVEITQSLYT